MDRIEPYFSLPQTLPIQEAPVPSEIRGGTPNRISFYIDPPEDREGWTVIFQRPGEEALVFLSNVHLFSTIAQMVAEGLRRVDGEGVLEVIDPSGSWDYWLSHSALGAPRTRSKIPTHFSY